MHGTILTNVLTRVLFTGRRGEAQWVVGAWRRRGYGAEAATQKLHSYSVTATPWAALHANSDDASEVVGQVPYGAVVEVYEEHTPLFGGTGQTVWVRVVGFTFNGSRTGLGLDNSGWIKINQPSLRPRSIIVGDETATFELRRKLTEPKQVSVTFTPRNFSGSSA